MRADDLIRDLNLRPHPEGGAYAEVFRSDARVQASDRRGERRALTTIYFLLRHGERSRLHRVASDEVWHFYEGDPLELTVVDPSFSTTQRIRLGAVASDARPVFVVPAGAWQSARPAGAY